MPPGYIPLYCLGFGIRGAAPAKGRHGQIISQIQRGLNHHHIAAGETAFSARSCYPAGAHDYDGR